MQQFVQKGEESGKIYPGDNGDNKNNATINKVCSQEIDTVDKWIRLNLADHCAFHYKEQVQDMAMSEPHHNVLDRVKANRKLLEGFQSATTQVDDVDENLPDLQTLAQVWEKEQGIDCDSCVIWLQDAVVGFTYCLGFLAFFIVFAFSDIFFSISYHHRHHLLRLSPPSSFFFFFFFLLLFFFSPSALSSSLIVFPIYFYLDYSSLGTFCTSTPATSQLGPTFAASAQWYSSLRAIMGPMRK